MEKHEKYEMDKNCNLLDSHTAACIGDLHFFYEFARRNIDKTQFFSKNKSGWTPLMYACEKGHSELVHFLHKYSNGISMITPCGKTLLMLAVCSGDEKTIAAVFNNKQLEDIDYKGWTALFHAVYLGRENCVTWLLNKGANINAVDMNNETPLMIAIKSGVETMVMLLLKTNTNLYLESNTHETAITLTSKSNNLKIMELIDEHMLKYPNKPKMILSPMPREPEATFTTPKMQTPKVSLAKKLTPSFKNSFLKFNQTNIFSPQSKVSPKILTPTQLDFNHIPTTPHSPCLQQNVSLCKFGCLEKNVKNTMSVDIFSKGPSEEHNVQKFLKWINLEKYLQTFEDEEIDFNTLMTLTDEDLKEIGITLMGPRKKILLAIEHLKNKYCWKGTHV